MSTGDRGLGIDADGERRETGDGGPEGTLAGDLLRSPVLHTLTLMTLGWLAVWWSGITPTSPWTAAPPVDVAVYTLVTANYAHASTGHVMGNAVVVAICGVLVARNSSTIRFHLFFILTGAASTAAAVWFYAARPDGEAKMVLGASGAALALLGYLVAANTISDTLASWSAMGRAAGLAVLVGLTAVITYRFSGPHVANVSHATGVLLGLVAGRLHLLRARSV